MHICEESLGLVLYSFVAVALCLEQESEWDTFVFY